MSANDLRVNDLGSPSFVALIAERLAINPREDAARASPPAARAPQPAGEAAPRRYAADLRTEEGRMLLAFGLWLRGAIVGAGLVVIALLQLFGGDDHPERAFVLAAGGVLLAVVGWRRAGAAIAAADARVHETPAVPAGCTVGTSS